MDFRSVRHRFRADNVEHAIVGFGGEVVIDQLGNDQCGCAFAADEQALVQGKIVNRSAHFACPLERTGRRLKVCGVRIEKAFHDDAFGVSGNVVFGRKAGDTLRINLRQAFNGPRQSLHEGEVLRIKDPVIILVDDGDHDGVRQPENVFNMVLVDERRLVLANEGIGGRVLLKLRQRHRRCGDHAQQHGQSHPPPF